MEQETKDLVSHVSDGRLEQAIKITTIEAYKKEAKFMQRLLPSRSSGRGKALQCCPLKSKLGSSQRLYDRATSRLQLPDISQRQYHQVLRRSSSEKVVASALRAPVDADPCDSVHTRIGPRRVPDGCVGGKKVNPRLSEPGTTLAQGGERWHGRGVSIEVIPAHAIQNEQPARSLSLTASGIS